MESGYKDVPDRKACKILNNCGAIIDIGDLKDGMFRMNIGIMQMTSHSVKKRQINVRYGINVRDMSTIIH